jgi:hypothetical protein
LGQLIAWLDVAEVVDEISHSVTIYVAPTKEFAEYPTWHDAQWPQTEWQRVSLLQGVQ